MRGFMNARGQPDGPRGARIVLKDYISVWTNAIFFLNGDGGGGGDEFWVTEWELFLLWMEVYDANQGVNEVPV